MKYHWLEDRIFQKQIQLIRKQGIYNWEDYLTKNHPSAYHRLIIPNNIVHFLPHSNFTHS